MHPSTSFRIKILRQNFSLKKICLYKKRKRSINNELQKKYLAKELKVPCAIILHE